MSIYKVITPEGAHDIPDHLVEILERQMKGIYVASGERAILQEFLDGFDVAEEFLETCPVRGLLDEALSAENAYDAREYAQAALAAAQALRLLGGTLI